MQKVERPLKISCLIIGVITVLLTIYKIISYHFHIWPSINIYYPNYTTNNVGALNDLAYFTILSNVFISIYFICFGLSLFNIKFIKKLANNTYFQGCATLCIFLTGIIFCFVLMPFFKFFAWNSVLLINNLMEIWFHIIVPILATILWFLPIHTKPIKKRFILFSLIFPFIYTVFTLVRGFIINWFPYPFFDVYTLHEIAFKNAPFNLKNAVFILMFCLVVLIVVFVLTAWLLMFVKNKLIKKHNAT